MVLSMASGNGIAVSSHHYLEVVPTNTCLVYKLDAPCSIVNQPFSGSVRYPLTITIEKFYQQVCAATLWQRSGYVRNTASGNPAHDN